MRPEKQAAAAGRRRRVPRRALPPDLPRPLSRTPGPHCFLHPGFLGEGGEGHSRFFGRPQTQRPSGPSPSPSGHSPGAAGPGPRDERCAARAGQRGALPGPTGSDRPLLLGHRHHNQDVSLTRLVSAGPALLAPALGPRALALRAWTSLSKSGREEQAAAFAPRTSSLRASGVP